MSYKVPKIEIPNLVKRYEAGERVKDIALYYGIHIDTVGKIAVRNGAKKRVAHREPINPWLWKSPISEKIVQLYMEGYSLYSIGAKYKVGPTEILNVLKYFKVHIRNRHESEAMAQGLIPLDTEQCHSTELVNTYSGDGVICALCGNIYNQITNSHLIYKHGVSLEMYRKKFPDASLCRKLSAHHKNIFCCH